MGLRELFDEPTHPPAPARDDAWVVRSWREAWPDEDLTGIAEELGIEG